MGRTRISQAEAGGPSCLCPVVNVTASGTPSSGVVTPLPHAYEVQKSPDGSGPTGDHLLASAASRLPKAKFANRTPGGQAAPCPTFWTRIGGGGSGGEPKNKPAGFSEGGKGFRRLGEDPVSAVRPVLRRGCGPPAAECVDVSDIDLRRPALGDLFLR